MPDNTARSILGKRASQEKYRQKPEVKARAAEYMRKRRERPEIQAQEAAEHKRYRERIATMPKTDEERAVEKEYFKRYHAEHKKARRIKELKKRYGLTYEEYVGMIESQGGRCAICKTTDWGKKEPHVDHDHKTGKVRGILCSRCNTTLGAIGDDPEIAYKMALYLAGNE